MDSHPDGLEEFLQNSQKNSTVDVQKHLTRLNQDIQNPEAFISKYNDLKEKKFVYLCILRYSSCVIQF